MSLIDSGLHFFKRTLFQAHEHGKDDFNFNQITENIYIGNNQCCRIMLDELLVKEGIYSDISLEENAVDAPLGAHAYLWVPIKNNTAPTLDSIKITNSFIETNIKLGKKIYVHCQNGHGRAPTIVIAYLISTGTTFDDAYKLVKEKRPVMPRFVTQYSAVYRV